MLKSEIKLINELFNKAIRSAKQRPFKIYYNGRTKKPHLMPSGIHILYLSIAGTGKSTFRRTLPNSYDHGKVTAAVLKGSIDENTSDMIKSKLVLGAKKLNMFDEAHRLKPDTFIELLNVLEEGTMKFSLARQYTGELKPIGTLNQSGYRFVPDKDRTGGKLQVRFSSIFFAEWMSKHWDTAFKSRLFPISLSYNRIEDLVKKNFIKYENQLAVFNDKSEEWKMDVYEPRKDLILLRNDLDDINDKFITDLKRSPWGRVLMENNMGKTIISRIIDRGHKFAADTAREKRADSIQPDDYRFFHKIWPLSVSCMYDNQFTVEELNVFQAWQDGERDKHWFIQEYGFSEEKYDRILNKLYKSGMINVPDELKDKITININKYVENEQNINMHNPTVGSFQVKIMDLYNSGVTDVGKIASALGCYPGKVRKKIKSLQDKGIIR